MKKSIIIKVTMGSLFFLVAILYYILNIGSSINTTNDKISLTKTKIKENSDLRLSYIETAFLETPEAFIYAGGSLIKKRRVSHMAVLVTHPQGNILFDSGLGSKIDKQFKKMPFGAKPFFNYSKKYSAAKILKKYNEKISSIFVSHLHWDHASGIPDFHRINVFTMKEEYDVAYSKNVGPPSYIKEQYENHKKWKMIPFKKKHYEIYDESFDLYGDGSIIFVKISGHSNGSIGMFVNFSQKKRYFFTGDTTWALEGFQKPAEKFAIASLIVDDDKLATKREIIRIHKLMKAKPSIKVIPAHDFNAYKSIKNFPQYTKLKTKDLNE